MELNIFSQQFKYNLAIFFTFSSISSILSGTIGIHYGHVLIHFKVIAENSAPTCMFFFKEMQCAQESFWFADSQGETEALASDGLFTPCARHSPTLHEGYLSCIFTVRHGCHLQSLNSDCTCIALFLQPSQSTSSSTASVMSASLAGRQESFSQLSIY